MFKKCSSRGERGPLDGGLTQPWFGSGEVQVGTVLSRNVPLHSDSTPPPVDRVKSDHPSRKRFEGTDPKEKVTGTTPVSRKGSKGDRVTSTRPKSVLTRLITPSLESREEPHARGSEALSRTTGLGRVDLRVRTGVEVPNDYGVPVLTF